MRRQIKLAVAGATLAALTAGGAGVAAASGQTEGPDMPITGSALEQASSVALNHLGEGRVTETEVGDEESYYEVEVTLDDGSQVDVQLDRAFAVVGSQVDSDSGADRD
jgi:uncharacterized membrane protein YkoI